MKEADFDEDDKWAKQFIPVWDEFYKSDYFITYINERYKKNMVCILE